MSAQPIADLPIRCDTVEMDAAELLAREALQRLNDLLAARDFTFIDEFDPSSALLIECVNPTAKRQPDHLNMGSSTAPM